MQSSFDSTDIMCRGLGKQYHIYDYETGIDEIKVYNQPSKKNLKIWESLNTLLLHLL